MVAKFDHRSALLVSEQTGFVANKRGKPLREKNQTAGPPCTANRIHGAVRSEQTLLNHVGWKQEKLQSLEKCFFLTSPFIELTRSWQQATPQSGRQNNGHG
jgi:hypothetical protein